MSDFVIVFVTSDLFTSNAASMFNKAIFSKNSGIIDKCVEVIVYLVNKERIPSDKVRSVKNTDTLKDLLDPRPPVIT